eukprot:86034_1
MGAYVPSYVLTRFTNSTSTAYIPYPVTDSNYNVYWYNIENKAFGFASTSEIDIIIGRDKEWYDTAEDGSPEITPLSNDRLSWSLYKDGYRAGKFFLDNNNLWRKQVYYKQCTNDGWKSPSAESMDGLCVMNNVVHNWNIKINLIENGWTQCYRE